MSIWCFLSREPEPDFLFCKEKEILYQESVTEDNELIGRKEIPNSKRSFIFLKHLIRSWYFHEVVIYKLILQRIIAYALKRDFRILLGMCSFFLLCLELNTVLIIKCIFIFFKCFCFLLQNWLAFACAD